MKKLKEFYSQLDASTEFALHFLAPAIGFICLMWLTVACTGDSLKKHVTDEGVTCYQAGSGGIDCNWGNNQ